MLSVVSTYILFVLTWCCSQCEILPSSGASRWYQQLKWT